MGGGCGRRGYATCDFELKVEEGADVSVSSLSGIISDRMIRGGLLSAPDSKVTEEINTCVVFCQTHRYINACYL